MLNSAPVKPGKAVILACSPRAGGNSDFMARCFAEGVEAAGGEAQIIFLRDLVLRPCRACQACSHNRDHSCPMAKDEDDYTESLFELIKNAEHVFVAAPIFFYALPAQFKGFIDRGQRLWASKNAASNIQGTTASGVETRQGEHAAPLLKPVTVGLVAGNKKGQKLFDGSLLTLRYFFDVFDAEIINTCLLRGYDGPKDLAEDQAVKQELLRCVSGEAIDI